MFLYSKYFYFYQIECINELIDYIIFIIRQLSVTIQILFIHNKDRSIKYPLLQQ
jgi:hypothetical protein